MSEPTKAPVAAKLPQVAEPPPEPVKLAKVTDEHGTALDKPPKAPTAPRGKVPRCIHQNERAPEGLKRFKVTCRNYHPCPVRYVLAKDQASAEAEYLRACALGEVEGLILVARELPD